MVIKEIGIDLAKSVLVFMALFTMQKAFYAKSCFPVLVNYS